MIHLPAYTYTRLKALRKVKGVSTISEVIMEMVEALDEDTG